MTVLTETGLIFVRSMKQSLRNPAWVVIGIVQPLLYLALFGPLLSPIIENTPVSRPATPIRCSSPRCSCSWACSAPCSRASR